MSNALEVVDKLSKSTFLSLVRRRVWAKRKEVAPASLKKCNCCLEMVEIVINNRQAHKGKYCLDCHDEWASGNEAWFEEMRKYRTYKKREEILRIDAFKCRLCKKVKSRSEFIKNKGKTYGIDNRCLECDKLRHQEEFKRRPELREYHKNVIKERCKTGEAQAAMKRWYDKGKEALSDSYIKQQLKATKVGKFLGSANMPPELIEAKRIKVKLNRELSK